MTQQKLKHKFFWNWDHSTVWTMNSPGGQNIGVSNPYTREPREFVRDFCRMADWCADHGIDGMGVVGLLRDVHGGENAARRVCAYAREKGVRVYLITGLYTYGGVWYEGDSKLSLNNFLRNNPASMGRDIDNNPLYVRFAYPYGCIHQPMACSSDPAVNNFILDSLALIFMKIPELGGVQMETGDCIPVCMCPRCRARRAEMQGGETALPAISLTDMACIYPEAAATVRSVSKDAWIICENYRHFRENPVYMDKENPAMKRLLKLPEDTFLQWGGDRRMGPEIWKIGPKLPDFLARYHNIQRFHRGTQWDGGRHTIAVDRVREMCQLALSSGMDSVSMFGESSPFHVNNEFNYLALQYFADYPANSVEQFATDVLAEKVGSAELGNEYLQMAALTKSPEKIPAAVMKIAGFTANLTDYEQIRRWNWLSSFLNTWHWEYRMNNNSGKENRKINLDFA